MVANQLHLTAFIPAGPTSDPARLDFAFPPGSAANAAGWSFTHNRAAGVRSNNMIADPLRHANQMIDDLIKKAETPISSIYKPKEDTSPTLDEMAEQAASEVELEFDEIDIRDNAGRDLGFKYVPEPSQSTVSVDVTDALQREMEDWGEGSFVQDHPQGDVRVNVSHPGLFVIDQHGNHIVGARIMCEFTTIEIDTP